MNFYYDLLNASFIEFMIYTISLTIVLVLALLFILNKFFPVELFEFNIKKEITKGIIIFLGINNIALFMTIFTSQAKIPNQAYIKKLEKENIIIEPYNVLFNHYNTLGFGICENNNYTGETCLNYLKYFEEKEKKKENQKNFDDEKQKIIEENIKK
ncbi:TPA: hypothetical protein RTG52_001790, partial [Campylobacter jejuni]|nr:hypothetical protein [Campylobacter jejuni]